MFAEKGKERLEVVVMGLSQDLGIMDLHHQSYWRPGEQALPSLVAESAFWEGAVYADDSHWAREWVQEEVGDGRALRGEE